MANKIVCKIKQEFDLPDEEDNEAYNCKNITEMAILEVIAECFRSELDKILKSIDKYKCRNLSVIFLDYGAYSLQKEFLRSLIDPNYSKYLNKIKKNELKTKLNDITELSNYQKGIESAKFIIENKTKSVLKYLNQINFNNDDDLLHENIKNNYNVHSNPISIPPIIQADFTQEQKGEKPKKIEVATKPTKVLTENSKSLNVKHPNNDTSKIEHKNGERKSRKCYTTKEKIKIIKLYETTYNFNASLTASKCNIDPSMVVRWYKKRAQLYHSMESKKKICRGPSSMYPKLENMLFDWLFDQKLKKKPMSYNKIRNQAKNIVASNDDIAVDPEFKFSNSWIRNFFKRFSFEHKKKLNSNHEQFDVVEEDRKKSEQFLSIIQPIASEYELEFTYSMDEIPIYIESDFDTIINDDENDVNLLKTKINKKKKFSVYLTISAAGILLPAYLVFRNIKKLSNVIMPSNVVANISTSSLISDKLMIDYLEKILEPIGKQATKSLLLINEYKTDFTDLTKIKMNNMNLRYHPIPGDLMTISQILNGTINKKFLCMYNEHLHQWYNNPHNINNYETVKKPSEQWIVDTISLCVKKMQIEVELVKSSFEKCQIVKKNRLW